MTYGRNSSGATSEGIPDMRIPVGSDRGSGPGKIIALAPVDPTPRTTVRARDGGIVDSRVIGERVSPSQFFRRWCPMASFDAKPNSGTDDDLRS